MPAAMQPASARPVLGTGMLKSDERTLTCRLARGESVSVGLSMRDASRSRSASSKSVPAGHANVALVRIREARTSERPRERRRAGRRTAAKKAKRCAAVAAFPKPSSFSGLCYNKLQSAKEVLEWWQFQSKYNTIIII